MKKGIHPKYEVTAVTCSCGNGFSTRSTISRDFHIEVCALCHPFYTGKQKNVETGGRVGNFNERYGKRSIRKTTSVA